jgi:hypothetical protein
MMAWVETYREFLWKYTLDNSSLVNRFCCKLYTHSKVDAGDTIQYEEYVCIRELGETEV